MILLVNDANIFIDLLKIDLLESFFQLPCEFHVTDLVAAEVQDNRDKLTACIEQGLLTKKGFSYQELMEIQLLSMSHKGLSIQDCSYRLLTYSTPQITKDKKFQLDFIDEIRWMRMI
jgi:hypothetical protein